MSWVATEAVRTQSPAIELGESLGLFLRDVLELRSSSGGGVRGSSTRVTEQMKRLFGFLVTAQYTGGLDKRGFTLRNVLIADELQFSPEDEDRIETIRGTKAGTVNDDGTLSAPQAKHEAGQWRSHVRLSNNFFPESINNPVPNESLHEAFGAVPSDSRSQSS